MHRLRLGLAWLALLALDAPAGTDIREIEVRFNNGAVQLAGTLVAPVTGDRHPAMVMVGGSGPSDRSHLLEIAEGFAREGLAVLAYDKRGTGHSTGNWVTGSLEDLADDATAAFHALAAQPEVDSRTIGYWGISQGGWVVPLTAGRSPAAFAIIVSGGGLSPREIETHNYLSAVERAGGGPEAERQARQLLDDYFAYLAGLQPRDALMQSLEPYRGRVWFTASGIEKVIPSEANRENWAWVANFRPGPSIAAMQAPVLVLLGAADPLTPAERTARAWREALAEAGPESKVVIVPDAGHGLRTGAHGGPLVHGFFSIPMRWLIDNRLLSPPASTP